MASASASDELVGFVFLFGIGFQDACHVFMVIPHIEQDIPSIYNIFNILNISLMFIIRDPIRIEFYDNLQPFCKFI